MEPKQSLAVAERTHCATCGYQLGAPDDLHPYAMCKVVFRLNKLHRWIDTEGRKCPSSYTVTKFLIDEAREAR